MRFEALPEWLSPARKLPPAEAHELAIRAKAGDRRAFDTLIRTFLGFLLKLVHSYATFAQIERDDLLAEALLGMTAALPKWDPEKGSSFLSFAVLPMRARLMRRVIADFSIVRNSAAIKSNSNAGRQLDAALDAPLPGTEDFTLLDTMESETPAAEEVVLAKESRAEALRTAIRFERRLSEQEAVVFRARVIAEDPATLDVCADLLGGLSRERARQIETQVLIKFRSFVGVAPTHEIPASKRCSKCKAVKPAKSFYLQQNGVLHAVCRACKLFDRRRQRALAAGQAA